MPKYDLRCQFIECGTLVEVTCRFEELQAQEAEPCPSCEQKTLRRIYSAPPVPHFKGSGFYATDYKEKK
jgi:putative FmdB family regulatory protein